MANLLRIAERVFLAGDFLISLVAFPCDQNYVVWRGRADRRLNGLGPVMDNRDPGSVRETGEDVPRNCFGVLTAGIVISNDHPICKPLGFPGHFRTFTGITVMLGEGFGSGSIYGNLMALLTASCFAVYTVIVRHKRQVNMLPTLLVSTLLIMMVAGITRDDLLDISQSDLFLCLLWGGVLSGFTSVCFIVASRHLAAAELTLFMLLEFALGPIWVWLFLNEVPSRWTLLGGALVIVAVVARALLELRSKTTSRPEG